MRDVGEERRGEERIREKRIGVCVCARRGERGGQDRRSEERVGEKRQEQKNKLFILGAAGGRESIHEMGYDRLLHPASLRVRAARRGDETRREERGERMVCDFKYLSRAVSSWNGWDRLHCSPLRDRDTAPRRALGTAAATPPKWVAAAIDMSIKL